MNNDEKILSLLETLVQSQAETNQRLTKLEAKVDKLEEGQAKLEQGQAKLEAKVDKIEKKIDKLVETDNGILDLVIKIDESTSKHRIEAQERYEELREDLNVVQYISSKNMLDITKLKAVK